MKTKYTQIFKGSKVVAMRIVSDLKELDIIAIVKDPSESAKLAGFGGLSAGPTEVLVHDDELAQAETLLHKSEYLNS